MRRALSPILLLTALAVGWCLTVTGFSAGAVTGESGPVASSATVPLPAGYVPDAECAKCHTELAGSFREVGMAKSFGRPETMERIEDFSAPPFFHEPSQRWFQMVLRDGRPVFRRWQLDDQGRPINLFEQPVEWVLGSGHRARSYLFSNPAGELFLLPLEWYSGAGLPGWDRPGGEAPQGYWGLAPGFDRPDPPGVARPVQRECLFCHNAYPGRRAAAAPSAGDGGGGGSPSGGTGGAAAPATTIRSSAPPRADLHGLPDVFPSELPHGIGCQRCHGPGARHVDLAAGGLGSMEAVRGAIVNPARLEAELRDDVCWQCHLQPSVTLPGLRRMGRGDWDFRPGQPLPDFNVHLEIVETARARDGERFEINHHPYRLIQSRCWQESGRRLSCLTCHDPHRKVPPAERAAHYRAACLTCHADDGCSRAAARPESAGAGGDGGQPGTGAGSPAWSPAQLRAHAADDCVICHMPARRTQDVVQAVMTDHLIQRRPPAESARLAPLEERDPVVEEVLPLRLAGETSRGPGGELLDLYRALAVVRLGGSVSAPALDSLEASLADLRPREPDAWLDLGRGLLGRGELERAEAALRAALERAPEHPEALMLLGAVHLNRRQPGLALALLERAAEAGAPAEVHYNRSLALLRLGRAEEARAALERTVALSPPFSSAWVALGQLREGLDGRDGAAGEAAADAYRRALALRPERTDAYLALGRLLLARGDRDEARRWLTHGSRVAARPAAVAALLEEAGLADGGPQDGAGGP